MLRRNALRALTPLPRAQAAPADTDDKLRLPITPPATPCITLFPAPLTVDKLSLVASARTCGTERRAAAPSIFFFFLGVWGSNEDTYAQILMSDLDEARDLFEEDSHEEELTVDEEEEVEEEEMRSPFLQPHPGQSSHEPSHAEWSDWSTEPQYGAPGTRRAARRVAPAEPAASSKLKHPSGVVAGSVPVSVVPPRGSHVEKRVLVLSSSLPAEQPTRIRMADRSKNVEVGGVAGVAGRARDDWSLGVRREGVNEDLRAPLVRNDSGSERPAYESHPRWKQGFVPSASPLPKRHGVLAIACLAVIFGVGMTLGILVQMSHRVDDEGDDADVPGDGAGGGSDVRECEVRGARGCVMEAFPQDVERRMREYTWRPGCPVPISDLRLLRVPFKDVLGQRQLGWLTVNRVVAEDMLDIFAELYEAAFPLHSMDLMSEPYLHGDDGIAVLVNNTSSFNCRWITGSNTTFSKHSWGMAIDVNTFTNPYIKNGHVLPPEAARYVNRTLHRPGMIHAGDTTVRAFKSRGFSWGGDWVTRKDYQHFEKLPQPAALRRRVPNK